MGQDVIRLTGLQLSGRIGVLEQEQHADQPLVIDTELHVDLAEAGRTDDLNHTVSYADIADIIRAVVTGSHFGLIEALAETLAGNILGADRRIKTVGITVHKPHAPLPYTFDDVAVTIQRSRSYAEAVSEPAVEPDSAHTPAPAAEAEGTVTTPTARLGPYDRISLADVGATAGTAESPSSTAQTRDPELPAAFPIRSVLALGSNLGDSRATLASAVQALQAAEGVVVVNSSPLARTKPVGGPANQRDYLNQVLEIETQLSPHQLLDLAQQIEADHNRVRDQRHGPRTLDVDIVTYASATIDTPRLQVPHPSAADRAFVLLPWSWMDPVALLNGRPVRELAAEADDHDDVVRLDEVSP